MSDEPYAPFENGDPDRGADGRFKPGCKPGPGSPVARKARQMRETLNEALYKTCSHDRLLVAVNACMLKAEAGDLVALKLIIERIAGPAVNVELIERLEALEEAAKVADGESR